jgi:tRNA(Ile)-lysidine synthase
MDAALQRPAEPLGPAEADQCLAMLGARPMVLAVSGGPDSMVLMGLAAERARRHGLPEPTVAVVDHGLRPEARAEAEFVAKAATVLGLRAAVLVWQGDKPSTSVPAAARRARYRLLGEHARVIGATALVTAHTLDDQAETILMRLARGSSLTGLAGMRSEVSCGGLSLCRPLLGVEKARLLATAAARGWRYVIDPSNRDSRFARPRWRRLLPLLAAEGLNPARLATLARRMAEADIALDHAARQAQDALVVTEGALWRLDARKLALLPAAVATRVLARLLAADDQQDGTIADDPVSGPRLERIEALAQAIAAHTLASTPLRRTLAGQVLSLGAAGQLSGTPEIGRRRGRVNRVHGPCLGKGDSGH